MFADQLSRQGIRSRLSSFEQRETLSAAHPAQPTHGQVDVNYG